MLKFLCFVVIALTSVVQSYACPLIKGIPDFNCDRKLTIVVIGDSIAYGTGDERHNSMGGYPLRVARSMRFAKVVNLAEPGLRAVELVPKLRKLFKKERDSDYAQKLRSADIVILDLGRNDRWLFGTPEQTYANLKTARNLITKNISKIEGIAPLVVTAVMILPNRGSQGPWMKALDKLILDGSTLSAPSDLRFDLVDKHLLNKDAIHPTSACYDSMAKVLLSYLKKTLPRRMRKLRPDSDKDGIFDIAETARFGTDPQNPDTDGDGVTDVQEVFGNNTDPRLPN